MHSSFHQRTLALLNQSNIALVREPSAEFTEWLEQSSLPIPKSFVEWAELDPEGKILSRFSNCDRFNWQELDYLPDGRRGLRFHNEHQDSFKALCLIDGQDDPPVYFVYYDGGFVKSTLRFSDYIFCRIFDWQHKFLLDEEGSILDLCYNEILLKSRDGLLELASRYEEHPSTSWIMDGKIQHEYRYSGSNSVRVTATFSEFPSEIHMGGAQCILELTGKDQNAVDEFEAELLEILETDVTAPLSHCPHHPKSLLRRLDHRIAKNLRVQLKYFSENPISDKLVEKIFELGHQQLFENRIEERILETRDLPSQEWIGGPEWGIRMKLVHIKHGSIRLEEVQWL